MMSEAPWDEFYETKVWLATKKNKMSYWRPFKRFMKHAEVDTPADLLRLNEENAKQLLRDFRDLNSSKYAPKTTNLASTAVSSFYDRHGLNVRVKRVRGYVQKDYKAFTQQEIRQLVKYADIRTKAIILCCYSSGSRISSLLGLTVDRIDLSKEPPIPIQFSSSETKYNIKYTTFISSEAAEALSLYLDHRKRKGEQFTSDSLIFTNKYGRPLTANAAGQMLHLIMERAGIDYDADRVRVGNHCFRNAFQRQLQVAQINQYLIEKMMGHSQNSTTARYSVGVTEEDLREAHQKADWSLGESLIEDVEDLKAQLEQLRAQLPQTAAKAIEEAITPRGPKVKIPGSDIYIQSVNTPTMEEQAKIIQREIDYIIRDKVISLNELPEYLDNGWHFQEKLPNGQYIVRRTP